MDIIRNTRLAVRSLCRSWHFTAAAAGTLALGIGAALSIATVSYSVWLKALPYARAEQIVTVWSAGQSAGTLSPLVSGEEFDAYVRRNAFEGMARYRYNAIMADAGGEPTRLVAYAVSAGFFNVLDVKPSLGRSFLTSDESDGAAPVVILSDAFWHRAWGADPRVLGKTLTAVGLTATIIGVMPPDVEFPSPDTDLWRPLTRALMSPNPEARAYGTVARLREGATIDSTQASLGSISRVLRDRKAIGKALLVPLPSQVFNGYRQAFQALLGGVGLLLLVAYANVLGLLVIRQASRDSDRAVRLALGAGRWNVTRDALLEGVILATFGTLLGIGLGFAGTRALVSVLPPGTPRASEAQIGFPALWVAAALWILSVCTCTLAPVLRRPPFRPDSRLVGPTQPGLARLRAGIVAAEIALSVLLLAGAGLVFKSVGAIVDRDYGFVMTDLLAMHLTVPLLHPKEAIQYQQPAARTEFYRQVMANIAEVPGVTSVSAVTGYPASSLGFLGSAVVSSNGKQRVTAGAELRACSSNYFRTMRVPVLEGTSFSDADLSKAVINESLASRLWPGASALGETLALASQPAAIGGGQGSYEVVGVVGNMRANALSRPQVFVPLARSRVAWADVVVRTAFNPAQLAAPIRQVVRKTASDALVEDLQPMPQLFFQGLSVARDQGALVMTLGILAIAFTAVGLYGLLAYSVSTRALEFATRMALGATPADVVRLVIRRAVRYGLTGAILGVACVLGLARVFRAQVFGLQKLDVSVLSMIAIAALLFVMAVAYVAARGVARIEPGELLRVGG